MSSFPFLALTFLSSFAVQERVRSVPRAAGLSGVVALGPPRRTIACIAQPAPLSRNRDMTQEGAPQNETWIALDPAAPLNVIGVSNDYRFGDAQAGVSVSLDGGTSWSASTLAALNPLSAKYSTQGDPGVAAYPGGTFFCSYIDFNRSDDQNRLCVARSDDGGLTWPTGGVVRDNSGPFPLAFEDKPLVAVDATGGAFDGNVDRKSTRLNSSHRL